MNPVRQLFEQYKTGGLAYIRSLKDEKTPESEVLDFKALSTNAAPMRDDDKKILSKALSAFANASGGVLVWGVDARGGKGDDPDVVADYKPISNLTRLHTDLMTLAPQLVSRPLEGIEYHLIHEDKVIDSGYLVMYIPEGGNEPHMATGNSLNRYYIRNGTTFLPMSHAMVADRFNRRAQSKLELEYKLHSGPVGKNRANMICVVLNVYNAGVRPAHAVTIALNSSTSFRADQLTMTGPAFESIMSGNGSRQLFNSDFGFFIHPQLMVDVGTFYLDVAPGAETDIVIPHELYAEDFHAKGELRISKEEILKLTFPCS